MLNLKTSKHFLTRPNKRERLEQLSYFKERARTLHRATSDPGDVGSTHRYEKEVLDELRRIVEDMDRQEKVILWSL